MSLKFIMIQSTAGNKFHSHRTAAEKGLCFAHTTALKTTALQILAMQQPFFAIPHAEITSAHLGSDKQILLSLLQCCSNKIFLKIPSIKLTDIALNQILLLAQSGNTVHGGIAFIEETVTNGQWDFSNQNQVFTSVRHEGESSKELRK